METAANHDRKKHSTEKASQTAAQMQQIPQKANQRSSAPLKTNTAKESSTQ
jgi:hypothetical protein